MFKIQYILCMKWLYIDLYKEGRKKISKFRFWKASEIQSQKGDMLNLK